MKYDKEHLKQLSWHELLDLLFKISDRIKLVSILNICLCIVYFFLEKGWMKTCCVTVTTIITVLLIIQTVMHKRIEKIMEDKPL
jgi:uncharacterized membrane protein